MGALYNLGRVTRGRGTSESKALRTWQKYVVNVVMHSYSYICMKCVSEHVAVQRSLLKEIQTTGRRQTKRTLLDAGYSHRCHRQIGSAMMPCSLDCRSFGGQDFKWILIRTQSCTRHHFLRAIRQVFSNSCSLQDDELFAELLSAIQCAIPELDQKGLSRGWAALRKTMKTFSKNFW